MMTFGLLIFLSNVYDGALQLERDKMPIPNVTFDNVQEGDILTVFRKITKEEERNWKPSWVKDMDEFVGCSGRVKSVNSPYGIQLVFESVWPHPAWTFPIFCLTSNIIKPPKTPKIQNGAKMKQDDANLLRQLSIGNSQDELGAFPVKVSPEIDAAIQRRKDKDAVELADKQAEVILNLHKRASIGIQGYIEEIRNARKSEKKAQSKLRALSRAFDYASETKNYIPLVALMDGTFPDASEAECKIPTDWRKHE